ncbi:M64 family metallopeptidase [Nesterenkonia natronophila]|nr:M64 family metallopeptidase [Nesterenkonia natronophila]
MSTQSQDIQWLNGFLHSLWPAASELIGAEFTHAAVTGFNHPEDDDDTEPAPTPEPPGPGPVPPPDPDNPFPKLTDLDPVEQITRTYRRIMTLPFRKLAKGLKWVLESTLRMSPSSTWVDLSRPPGVRAAGPDAITAYFPPMNADRHQFRTRISTLGKVGGALGISVRVDVYLRLRAKFSANEKPDPEIDEPHLDTNRRGEIFESLLKWKDEVDGELADSDLRDELGFLSTARYNREAARTATPERLVPTREVLPDGINIVLVPDGFDPTDLDEFDEYVQAARDRLYQPDEKRVNEPFHSFKSVLHLWELRPEQSRDGDFVVGAHRDGSGYRASLGNLARLAAIGRSAEQAASGTTILVFIAHREAQQFEEARADSRRVRAMAMGNVVLLPLRGDQDGDKDLEAFTNLLLHELGHTVLGNLADEYDQNNEDTYRGQERLAANLESQPVQAGALGRVGAALRFPRWDRWIRNPDHLPSWNQHPITGVEGGGYFGRGIWRPAQDCAMNSLPHDNHMAQFCAVCREQLTRTTRGLLEPGRFLVRIGDASGEAEFRTLEPERRGRTLITEQLRVSPGTTTDIQVSVVAGTLAEPWEVEARLDGAGRLQSPRDRRFIEGRPTPPRAWSFQAEAGDVLTIEIDSGCPFTPSDDMPHYTIELDCVPDPDTVEPPARPTQLTATQVGNNPVGTQQQARLRASSADPNGQDLRLLFEVVREGEPFLGRSTEQTDWIPADPTGKQVSGQASFRGLDGTYQIRAAARNRSGRSSRWSAPVNLVLHMTPPDNGGDGNVGGGNDGSRPRPPFTP